MSADITIPGCVVDHESFRKWARSDLFPQRGHFSFIDGAIWGDLTGEDFFSHNQVRGSMYAVVGAIAKINNTGYFCCRGMLWSNLDVVLSTEPDGMYFEYTTIRSGRIRLIDDASVDYHEIEGSPNMTLEVISDSSVKKDTIILKDKSAKAGVDEYWLVDARGAELRFEIWRLQDGQYVAAPTDEGWLVSAVFGRSFKLEQSTDRLGHPRFQLLVR